MRAAVKTSVLLAACWSSFYGCSSGDDDSDSAPRAGAPAAGSGGSGGNAGKGNAGSGARGGKAGHGGSTAGDAGAGASAGAAGSPSEQTGGAPNRGGSGNTPGGQAGESGASGAAGAAGAAGAGTDECIHALSGRYVLRGDGAVLYEPSIEEEHVITDGASGTPLLGARSVADGSYHGCAVLADRSVACWQTETAHGNTSGQLGNGTTNPTAGLYRASPVLLASDKPLTGIVALAETAPSTQYGTNTCAIGKNKRLYCWGELSWTVNDGETLRSGYAQAVTTDGSTPLTGVLQAAVTRELACALVEGTPNSVWCWGYNASGELATGDSEQRQYPVQIPGLAAPSKVVTAILGSGQNTACALDGASVRCWGYNGTSGAVGANTTAFSVPTPSFVVTQNGATALTGVTDVRAGDASFVALREDTLWLWGTNFANYAENYGVSGVRLVGSAGGLSNLYGPRYATQDDVYHDAMSAVAVSCGAL